MPSSGSGTGTPVGGVPVPPAISGFPLPYEESCVSLARYAQIIENPECGFWGVHNDDETGGTCIIWTESQRRTIARYLAEAQDEIEQVVRYPLCSRWFADERHNYAYPVQADWGKVIEAGVRAETTIQAGAAVNHATDPATVTVATAVSTDEIHVYYPGSDREITPQAMVVGVGTVTIYIPRCRMVAAGEVDNPETGLDYNDLTNFLATVDVIRVYNDPSTNAVLVWPHSCSAGCAANGCTEYTQTACMYVRNGKIGSIDVRPATYAEGTWTGATVSCCRGRPEIVRLNYRAGLTPLSPQAEDAIVRLAHSKMPNEVCGCETWTRLWRRDRFVPEVLTRERLNCPFGLNDGAWIAWRFTQMLKLVRGDVL